MDETMRTVFCLLAPIGLVAMTAAARADLAAEPDGVVIDGVRLPFDMPADLVGICLPSWHRGNSPDLDLRLVRVDGRANQDGVTLRLWSGAKLVAEPGDWLRLRGRPTDANVAAPAEIAVVVGSLARCAPAPCAPADFVDRSAEFEGRAIAGGMLQLDGADPNVPGATLRVADWPAEVLGRHVAVRGVIRRAGDKFAVEAPTWRLLELADMLGSHVRLEGNGSDNDRMWYRGQRIDLVDFRGKPVHLADTYGRRVVATGVLERQLRQTHQPSHYKRPNELAPTFVLRQATVELGARPWTHDRRDVRPWRRRFADGVELLEPREHWPNAGWEGNEASRTAACNWHAIAETLRHAKPATLDVLARRAVDAAAPPTLRLLYATMLAAADDHRGRQWLSGAVERHGDDFENAVWCLAESASMMPEDVAGKTDMRWAEPLLIRLMTAWPGADGRGDAELAEDFRLPVILARLGTPAAASVLVERALVQAARLGDDEFDSTLVTMVGEQMPVAHGDLVRLQHAARRVETKRLVFEIALRQQDVPVAVNFFDVLEEGRGADQLAGRLAPAMKSALESALPNLPPGARDAARLALAGAARDPAESFVALLDDAAFGDRDGALQLLIDLRSEKAIEPCTRLLRQAPDDLMRTGRSTTWSVEAAIRAIAAPGTAPAVDALIDLLDADLDRFVGAEPGENRRYVAIQLIAITGESFGTDAAAWRRWRGR